MTLASSADQLPVQLLTDPCCLYYLQTCPGSDITGDSRRRQLLSSDSNDAAVRAALLSMTGSRKLLQQKNYPFYPNDAGEALAILAITHRGLQAVFALVHWFINTNRYTVSIW